MANEFLGEVFLEENEQLEEENENTFLIIPGLGGDDFRLVNMSAKRPSHENEERSEKLLIDTGFSKEAIDKLSPVEKANLATHTYIYGTTFFEPERKAFGRAWQTISGLWEEDDETLTSRQVKENSLNDGFSDEDYNRYFTNIRSRREYEYTKDGLKKERALIDFYQNAADDEQIGFDLMHFVGDLSEFFSYAGLFKSAGKGLIKVGARFPKEMAKATEIASHFQINNNLLRSIINNAFVATGITFRQYASRYEMTPQEAAVHATLGTAIGVSIPLLGAGAKSIFRKCFDTKPMSKQLDEVMDNAFNEFYSVDDKVFKASLSSSKDKVMDNAYQKGISRFEEFLNVKMPGVKNPVSILNLNKYSPTAREFVKRFARIGVGDLDSVVVENEAYLRMYNFNKTYKKLLNISKQEQQRIYEESGKSLNDWIDLAIRGEDIPAYLPHRQMILSEVNNLMKYRNELVETATRLGVPDVQKKLGDDFLSAELATKKDLNYYDLEFAYNAGTAEVKDIYVPRVYDIDKIKANQEEFKTILANSFKKEKFKEIQETFKDRSPSERFELYHKQVENISIDVEKTYNDLVWSDISEELVSDPRTIYPYRMRSVRVTDKALLPFLKGGAFQHLLNDTLDLIKKTEAYRALNELGFVDEVAPDDLVNKIYTECTEAMGGKPTKKALRDISVAVRDILDVFLGKPTSLTERKFQFTSSILNGVAYTALLGKTAINSITDVTTIIAHFGLKDFVKACCQSMPKLLKEMETGLTKGQWKQVIEDLPDGLLEGSRSYINKIGGVFEKSNFIMENPFRSDTSNNIANIADKSSNFMNKVSGLYYWDKLIMATLAKKLVVRDLLKNPEVLGLTKDEVLRRLEDKVGYDNDFIERYVLNRVQDILIRPTLKDKPMFTSNTWLRPFFVFCSWKSAFKNKFLFPLLKGDFGFQHTRDALATLMFTSMVSCSVKNLLSGNKTFDYSTEEGRKEFLSNAFDKVFSELIGNLYCGIASYLGQGISSIYKYNKYNYSSASEMIAQQAPTFNYWDRQLTNIIKGTGLLCRDIFVKDGNISKTTKNTWKRFVKGISNHPIYDLVTTQLFDDRAKVE